MEYIGYGTRNILIDYVEKDITMKFYMVGNDLQMLGQYMWEVHEGT